MIYRYDLEMVIKNKSLHIECMLPTHFAIHIGFASTNDEERYRRMISGHYHQGMMTKEIENGKWTWER